jgi:hypothetical protein
MHCHVDACETPNFKILQFQCNWAHLKEDEETNVRPQWSSDISSALVSLDK